MKSNLDESVKRKMGIVTFDWSEMQFLEDVQRI